MRLPMQEQARLSRKTLRLPEPLLADAERLVNFAKLPELLRGK
jgi:hypothetical protein